MSSEDIQRLEGLIHQLTARVSAQDETITQLRSQIVNAESAEAAAKDALTTSLEAHRQNTDTKINMLVQMMQSFERNYSVTERAVATHGENLAMLRETLSEMQMTSNQNFMSIEEMTQTMASEIRMLRDGAAAVDGGGGARGGPRGGGGDRVSAPQRYDSL